MEDEAEGWLWTDRAEGLVQRLRLKAQPGPARSCLVPMLRGVHFATSFLGCALTMSGVTPAHQLEGAQAQGVGFPPSLSSGAN